jgi:hypothetical protein
MSGRLLAGAKEERSVMGLQESKRLVYDTSLGHGQFLSLNMM